MFSSGILFSSLLSSVLGCETLWRHRHCDQQRQLHQSHWHPGDAHEEVRPHASDQHARHLPGLQVRGTLPEGERAEGAQPPHTQQLAAAEPESALVQGPRGLHNGQVRHVHVCPRHGGRV